MSRTKMILALALLIGAVAAMSHPALGQEDNMVKWYGIGGQITKPYRWLGRLGITGDLGAEIIFGMEHLSDGCSGDKDNGSSDDKDCDFTKLDIGAGFIYDFVPESPLTPYVAGRFILTMIGNGSSDTSGTVETALGAEYVIMRRLGLSGELNFSFGTSPSRIRTTTLVRAYFYL